MAQIETIIHSKGITKVFQQKKENLEVLKGIDSVL